MSHFYLRFFLALLLILVHSFYSWNKDKKGDHLIASFTHFMESSESYPTMVTSAVEQSTASYARGGNLHLLCEEIIQIVAKHPLGRFTFKS